MTDATSHDPPSTLRQRMIEGMNLHCLSRATPNDLCGVIKLAAREAIIGNRRRSPKPLNKFNDTAHLLGGRSTVRGLAGYGAEA